MHELKKVLSLLLCVAMLLSMSSIGVFAEEAQEEAPAVEETEPAETKEDPEPVEESEPEEEPEEEPEQEQPADTENEEDEIADADPAEEELPVEDLEEVPTLAENLDGVELHVSYDSDSSIVTVTGLPEGLENVTCHVYSDTDVAAVDEPLDEDGEFVLDEDLVFGEDYTVDVNVLDGEEEQTLTCVETIAASTGYITVNIPYSAFYGDVVGLSGTVDTVSSATTQKAGNCKNVWFAAEPEISGGVTINGVAFPAEVSRTIYDEMKANDEGANAAWHIAGVLDEMPDVYTFMQSASSVSDLYAEETEATTTATLVTGVRWGDYEINLDSGAGIAAANVYGAYIVTSDGAKYALRQSANLWTPSNYYECAWSLSDSYYASTEGETVTGMTFITKDGIVKYTFDDLYVVPQYDGSVTATLSDDCMSITLEGLPEDIEDALVTVSTGGRQKTYAAVNAEIDEAGTVALTDLPMGADYTVQITCSNYATITADNTVTVFGALINIPYDQFYSEVAGMSNGSSVDVVASATTGKVRGCSNVWFADGSTIAGGTDVEGIVFPVKMNAAAYTALTESGASANDAYYISDIVREEPAVYSVLTYTDGSCSFASVTGEEITSSVTAEITSNSNWGDYQITLSDVTNTPSDVYGVYLTTADGDRYAMKQAENLWNPHNYTEIAFSVGYKTSEPHGGRLTYDHTKGLEGKTVTEATFIRNDGIVTYTFDGLYVAPHTDAEVTAILSEDGMSVTFEGLPEDIENPVVTVTTGGRGATVLASKVAVAEDGSVALTEIPFTKEFSVIIESDNYAAITAVNKLSVFGALINIPYSQFYSDVVGMDNGSSVDAVASATTGKVRGCSNVWFADGSTITGGTDVEGIVFPVQLTYEAYADLKESVVSANDAYYISGLVNTAPAVYSVLNYEDGCCGFASVTGEETTSSITAAITSNSNWGDYQITLSGATNTPSDVYGVYLTTSDGERYAMKQAENLWTPRNYNEIAFSVGYKTSEPHGGRLSYDHTKGLEGKTVTKATFIRNDGIVTYTFDGLYVAPHADSEVTAVLSEDGMSVTFEGMPEDIENPVVTVTTGGRGATVLANKVAVAEDGTVALTEVPFAKEYSVIIESDNYAAITAVNKLTVFGALINIPYDEFYSQVAGMDNGSSVDAVASATTGKVRSCSNVWFAAEPTIAGGTDVEGIVFPVQLTYEAYTALKESVVSATDAYYISGLVTEVPEVYSVLTYAEGECSFSAVSGETRSTAVDASIISDSNWGDYQITLSGVTNAPADVYGVYLTTEEGYRYAMKQAENLWNPHNYTEIAFSVGYKTSEPHGGTLSYAHTKRLEGETITKATFITKNGIIEYNFNVPQMAAWHYSGKITATLSEDDRSVTVTGLPYYISNPEITIATGGRQRTYLVQNGVPANGMVELTASPAANTSYTVTVTSDNYAALTTTVTTGDTIAAIDYPATLKLGVGETVTETPAAVPLGVESAFTFATSNSKIVTVDAATGKLTAKKTGTAVITVTGDNGVTTQCTVKVVKAPSKVTVSPTIKTIAVGMGLVTTAKLSSGSASRLTYTSNNEAVATVDENGVITGVSAGTAKITVQTFNKKKATVTVTVKAVAESVTLNKAEADLTVKDKLALKTTFTAANAYNVVTWTSSDPSVAQVSSKGVVTAKKAGTAVITVTAYGGAAASCEVRVWAAPTGIALDKKTAVVSLAETTEMQLTATVKPLDTANPTVTFSSSNKKIATVSADGVVTFIGKTGKVTITAKTANGKKATCTITVKK